MSCSAAERREQQDVDPLRDQVVDVGVLLGRVTLAIGDLTSTLGISALQVCSTTLVWCPRHTSPLLAWENPTVNPVPSVSATLARLRSGVRGRGLRQDGDGP